MKTTKTLVKKTVLFTMLALLGMTQAVAQGYEDYEYVPFVREGVKWVYYYVNNDSPLYGYDQNLALGTNYITLEIKGDTIIDGKTYKAMHKYSGSAIDWDHDTIPIYLREEDKVVYGIVPDSMFYHDCLVGYGPEFQYLLMDGLYGQIYTGQEFVLYDFADTKSYYESEIMFAPDVFDEHVFSYIGSDMITVGTTQVKRHVINRWNVEDYIIEGVGFDGHNSGFTLHYFYSMTWADPKFHLSHVIENGEIVYKSVNYEEPEPEDYEYVPFVREGVKWVYCYDNPFSASTLNMPEGLRYYAFEMKGDTVYEGKHYKPVKLYYINYNGDEILQDFTPVWLREENKVVYAIHLDGHWYPQCPVGITSFVDDLDPITVPQKEFVLYDFNDPEAYYQQHVYYWDYMSSLGADTVRIGTHYSKRYTFKNIYGIDEYVIEGIGCDGHRGMPLCYFPMYITGLQVYYGLSHVIEDGEIVYKGKEYNEDMYMPLLREGVKWVNEKVTIQNGDTTRCYYTYEISGRHPIHQQHEPDYYACYYYIGNGNTDLNIATDSIISGVYESDDRFECNMNYALNAIVNAGSNMLNYRTPILGFQFLYQGLRNYNGEMTILKDELFENQREQFFTEENLVMADPIIIDNCTISRLAYLDEQGDTLCYVVEGIGFDSYNMGDLLTPFMIPPDPNADYQEYCGLSHVIKDGKIIYKGMRYHPNVPGDVNSDGEVTIADANNVIDIVVMGGNSGHTRTPAADVNGDGEINIADINAIIEIIISNMQNHEYD